MDINFKYEPTMSLVTLSYSKEAQDFFASLAGKADQILSSKNMVASLTKEIAMELEAGRSLFHLLASAQNIRTHPPCLFHAVGGAGLFASLSEMVNRPPRDFVLGLVILASVTPVPLTRQTLPLPAEVLSFTGNIKARSAFEKLRKLPPIGSPGVDMLSLLFLKRELEQALDDSSSLCPLLGEIRRATAFLEHCLLHLNITDQVLTDILGR